MDISRPVIAFALLRQCSEMMSTDLLGGISILVRPIVADQAEKVFDSNLLADRLATSYGVSIPASALEAMTERLVAAGVLRIETGDSGISRAVYCNAPPQQLVESSAESDFQEILDEYLKHASDCMKTAGKSYDENTLTQAFLRHLATLDFSAIRAKPIIGPGSNSKIVGPAAKEQIALSEELADKASLDSIVASYVTGLQQHNPSRLQLLTKVADGALAAELVFDLQAPTSSVRLTSTTVALDTPLVLSYLDLSSSQDKIDARQIVKQIQETGARIAAFRHSIEEAEGVLKAIQNAREFGDAYGPSVHRLSNSTFRAYFDSMVGSVGRAWTAAGFEILPETATHYHKNFTPLEEEDLVSAIRTSALDRVLTRERDAKSVAETLRRLAGGHIPVGNIASCRFLFATTNASLQRRVAQFLTRKKHVLEGEINPIITSRYLSGLCWLLCGGKSDQSPTMARLLANCAAALRIRPELAERTKRFLSEIDPEKAKHFEALMTNDRASQYLVEATLGDANVITANNVEDIYEEVQRRAAEKVAKEKDLEYGEAIQSLNKAVLEKDTATSVLRDQLTSTQLEAGARALEVTNLQYRASTLETEGSVNRKKLAQQELDIQRLGADAASATGAALQVQQQLESQWATGRSAAARYAANRTRQVRALGVLVMFGLFLLLGYADKFIVPKSPEFEQQAWNVVIIGVQALLAISGFSLLFDSFVKAPLDRMQRHLYKRRLAEFGIPE